MEIDTDWRAALRAHRQRRRLTYAEVARRSGFSLSAVKAYESGTRNPSAQALDAIIGALGLTRDEANAIRAGAGFTADWQGALRGRYTADLLELTREADATPWPVFITNQGSYLVHVNPAFELVWDVDLDREFPDPLQRNLLAGASLPRFTRCIENYNEVMSFFIGLIKGDPRVVQDLERPAPWYENAAHRLLDGDPGELRRLLAIWESAKPIPHKIRHTYSVTWRWRGERRMRFLGRHTVCDIANELNWQEWVPADAPTWSAMASLLQSDQPRHQVPQETSGSMLHEPHASGSD